MKLPNNGASSVGGEFPMPMDDASPVPTEEPQEMPNDGDIPQDMGSDDIMSPETLPGADENMPQDETMDVINQLSQKDKEAVKAYAESLISKSENTNTEEEIDAPTPDGLNMEAPINETFIFKKQQLNKIMENFSTRTETDEVPSLVKKQKNSIKNTPFNAPDFE